MHNGHLNHIKDIHEVQDIQPRPFSDVGMAARARSVRLMYTDDWKLDRKGGARTHPKQHHPLPQGSPTIYMQTVFSSSQILPAIAPGSSSSLTDGLGFGWAWVRVGGAWQRSPAAEALPPLIHAT